MLRRVAPIPFVLAALMVAAGCGHQVTPSSRTESDLSGHIVVRFQVNGALDFTNITYAVAIDTCGNGVPYPQAALTGYNSYSYVFFIGGAFGSALPELYQYYANPNSTGSITKLLVNNLNPSTTEFLPNYNNQNNEFQFVFLRSDLNNPLGVTQPCPNITPAPSASPTSGATPTASPTPAVTPSAGATPTPAPSPTATAQFNATTWIFNFITFQGNTPVDSLGIGGPTDNTFSGIYVDTTQQVSDPIFRSTPNQIPSNPSAYILGGEIDNYP
jgi:hypothetical protein